MIDSDFRIVCFGEVLFDVFPDYRKIGGAPLNVAYRLASYGIRTSIISRVGDDLLGAEIIDFVNESGIAVDCIQKDTTLSTGEVIVTLDEDKNAQYTIKYPVAWDKIEMHETAIAAVKESDAFVFGSLACRDAVSLKTLLELLKWARYKIFDVNIRKPFYSKKLLLNLLFLSDFVKFNEGELLEVAVLLGVEKKSMEEQIHSIGALTTTQTICVTRGAEGAVLYFENEFYYNNGYVVEVVDTVGSGDSFLAALVHQLLLKNKPQVALDYACAVGAVVVQKQGANPLVSEEEVRSRLNFF